MRRSRICYIIYKKKAGVKFTDGEYVTLDHIQIGYCKQFGLRCQKPHIFIMPRIDPRI